MKINNIRRGGGTGNWTASFSIRLRRTFYTPEKKSFFFRVFSAFFLYVYTYIENAGARLRYSRMFCVCCIISNGGQRVGGGGGYGGGGSGGCDGDGG